MSIFGKMDAAQIPSNPFFIEKGVYEAEVTKAYYKTSDDKKQLVITFIITDENSQFRDSQCSKYYTLPDEDMTNEQLALLPVDEQKRIRQSLSSLKRDLCGNESNSSQKGLGVSIDDLNDEENPWNPESIVGTKVKIGISNYGASNEGVNVRWVNLHEV